MIPPTVVRYARARAQLRQLRGTRSLREFAAACGIRSPSLILEYEAGTRTPTYANALGIERATGAKLPVEAWGFDRETARRVAA